jgi:predicted transcriptional regulator
MESNSATIDATRWFGGATLQKKAAVYHLLINEKQIAARIAETLDINKSTVSRWIRRLVTEQYIEQDDSFLEHQKEMEQVREGSVSLRFKAYKPGPRAQEMENTILKLQTQVGVHQQTPVWSPLPGGVEPRIDIHRLDWNLPVNTNGPRGGQPWERSLGQWEREGVRPHGKELRGSILFAAPDIESAIGPWRVRFRRRMSRDEDGNPIYGRWCNGHPIRITLPNRMIITPEEALDSVEINKRIADALYHVMGELSKTYGWTLGLPNPKNSQQYEAGTLVFNPALARQVKERRQRGETRMLPLADGITADGSHDLLDAGFVHIDCETPEQAGMQANPVLTIDTIQKKLTEMAENTARVANEATETIEEHAVNTTTRIADNMQTELLNLIEKMNNTYEEMIGREETRRLTEETRRNQAWDEAFDADRGAFVDRMNRAVARFENALRRRGIAVEEGQMLMTDFMEP